VLGSPHYHGLQRYFRQGQYGTYVEFYEMQLAKNDWFRPR